MAPRRRLWLTAKGPKDTVPVYAVDGTFAIGRTQLEGYLDFVAREIVVNVAGSVENTHRTLLHELLHLAFDGMPPAKKRRLLGNPRREEAIVRHLDKTLFDILHRNGWLRLPEPPT